MHRYRKGQMWRPPTAAESAAQADAAEAHRRSPSQAQDYTPVGQHVLVKTPSAGIAARDGNTILPANCTRSIQVVSGANMAIADTDEVVIVHNLFEQSISGNAYVPTALTECGMRYALPVSSFKFGKLDANLAQGNSANVSIWDGDPLADTNVNVTAYDWFLASGESIASGKKVKIEFYGGKWYVTAAEC